MRFLKNDELLQIINTPAMLFVVPDERAAEELAKKLEDLNGEMDGEGSDFRLKVVSNIGELKNEREMLDKVPVFFMLESEYAVDEEPNGLVKLIPLGLREDMIEGQRALNKDVWKWIAWKLWKIKIGEPEAIEIARKELGSIEMGETD